MFFCERNDKFQCLRFQKKGRESGILFNFNLKRKMRKGFLALVMLLSVTIFAQAQVSVTSANGMSVTTLLDQHFSGGGVVIFNGRFNGQPTINSNAIGTFTNPTTTGNNMPVAGGIVMATGDCQDAASGTFSGTTGSHISPACDGDDKSPALTSALRSSGNTQTMNDVAVLQFDFIPSGEQVSFKYSFASEEYPDYVCSSFNDVFGFFISGPYDENGQLITNEGVVYQYTNIALIPGTDLPVMINTVNNGISAGSASNCVLTNTQYHRMNDNNNCKMNGYTTELSTSTVNVVPCRIYKMELATCDVGDWSFNSAVYLSANSFRIDEFSLSHPDASTPTSGANPGQFVKGCDYYDVSMYINRPATDGETHMLVFQGGDAVEGEDYELLDLQGNPAGAMLTFNEGDTAAHLRIKFLENPNDAPGDVKTLVIMTEEVNDCAARDTLSIEMIAPTPLTHKLQRETPDGWQEITDDIVYCGDVLPVNEELKIEIEGEIGDLQYLWSYGNEQTEQQNTVPVVNPMTVLVTVTDGCGRVLEDSVTFRINNAQAVAAADKDNICVGDMVTLTTDEAVQYVWTSEPYDATLAANANVREPQVSPTTTTRYSVEITDQHTCKASANVLVKVIPSVKAALRLTPTKTTLSEPDVEYQDLTVNSYSRIWDFGDGQTSTASYGIVSYSSSDTATYQVRLIAFNEANCPDTAYGTVQIRPDFTLWMPNSFTPGSGDVNSMFGPVFAFETEYELSIYSRNGDRIFVSSPKEKGWDGKVNGEDFAPNGSYVWVLMYRDGDGLLKRETGMVNLILNLR